MPEGVRSWKTTMKTNLMSGFPLAYLLDHIRAWTTKRKERSRDIFEPLYVQLSEAHTQITNTERPSALSYDFWHQLNLPRRVKAIPSALQQPLRELYIDIIPAYEASWKAVNEHGVEQILTPWTLKLGIAPDLTNIQRFPKYYRFLTAPKFHPALLEIQTPGIIPLWSKVTNREAIIASGLTLEQFLKQLWGDAQATPMFQDLRNLRQTALRVLSELIPAIRKRIVE